MHATATGFASLFGWRLSLGLFEAPCFPANNSIVGAWFPRSERARAIGVYTSAEYVALGFATPLLLWLMNAHGWRALFLVSGAAGLLLVIGVIYQQTGSFDWALGFIGMVTAAGAAAWIFLVGDLKPIVLKV